MKQTGQNHHGDSNDGSAFDDSDNAQGDLGGGSFHGTSYRPIGGGDTAPPGTTELRLAPADFTTQPVGSDPNPRTISDNIAGFNGLGDTVEDPTNSAWLYVLGQFVDHDIDKEALNPAVNVDVTDPVTGATISLGGSAGPNAVNTVAGYLDLSEVYGSDAATAASLRNADGTMKEGPGGIAARGQRPIRLRRCAGGRAAGTLGRDRALHPRAQLLGRATTAGASRLDRRSALQGGARDHHRRIRACHHQRVPARADRHRPRALFADTIPT